MKSKSMLTFRTQSIGSLLRVIIGVHVMEDSPMSMCTVLLKPKCLLQGFFKIAGKSSSEVWAPNTKNHAVSEYWGLGWANKESDI